MPGGTSLGVYLYLVQTGRLDNGVYSVDSHDRHQQPIHQRHQRGVRQPRPIFNGTFTNGAPGAQSTITFDNDTIATMQDGRVIKATGTLKTGNKLKPTL